MLPHIFFANSAYLFVLLIGSRCNILRSSAVKNAASDINMKSSALRDPSSDMPEPERSDISRQGLKTNLDTQYSLGT